MSGVYALEPPTAGKVVLKTSVGDLDVELWAKEAPRAARNFVQLCLEGYYDRTVFHRIVKDFMVQGGDPTGTGQGGESVYGAPFEDEFHSRLQFRRRGMVACANANEPNTNGSQFFVTLDRSDWLNKKHTIFGTVTGDTVYNLMRLSEYDVDEHDRPKDPPQILGTEVLWNPFDDIVPRRLERPPPPEEKAKKKKLKAKDKLPTKLRKDLLSFGDDEELEDEDGAGGAGPGPRLAMKSAHDVLDDARLVKGDDARHLELAERLQERVHSKLNPGAAPAAPTAPGPAPGPAKPAAEDFGQRMRAQIAEKQQRLGHAAAVQAPAKKPRAAAREAEVEAKGGRGKGQGRLKVRGGRRADLAQVRIADGDLVTESEARRRTHRSKRKLTAGREDATLAKLQRFTAVFGQAPKEPDEAAAGGGEGPEASGKGKASMDLPPAWRVDAYLDMEDDDDGGAGDWRSHRLECPKDVKRFDDKEEDPDDYEVFDPLLARAKAAKPKRRRY